MDTLDFMRNSWKKSMGGSVRLQKKIVDYLWKGLDNIISHESY